MPRLLIIPLRAVAIPGRQSELLIFNPGFLIHHHLLIWKSFSEYFAHELSIILAVRLGGERGKQLVFSIPEPNPRNVPTH